MKGPVHENKERLNFGLESESLPVLFAVTFPAASTVPATQEVLVSMDGEKAWGHLAEYRKPLKKVNQNHQRSNQ